MSRAAVFLDKDGTLVPDVPFNVDPERMSLAPGSANGLRLLHNHGYKLIVVSNQSGVARDLFPEAALAVVKKRLGKLLAEVGVPLAGFYYCPHLPTATLPEYAVHCDCRKPQPGMLIRAAFEHDIDLATSWLIGDTLDDVEAGHCAGCQSILLINGGETEWNVTAQRIPECLAPDLGRAARAIVWRYPPAGVADVQREDPCHVAT
jgi:D,D-heptose 1,7-bisphosphate phosphatase